MQKKYDEYKWIYILLVLISLSGCKKKAVLNDNEEQTVPVTGTRTEFTLDSIYLYAKQVYLWNEALPAYNKFSPRERYINTGPQLSMFKRELFDISQFKINPVTGLPFEASSNNNPKYSFLEVSKGSSQSTMAGSAGDTFIMASTLMQIDNKDIGYVALSSFPSLNNSRSQLNDIFKNLASAHTEFLILDLRYNGGGYVETAEYIADLIAPSSLTGKVMYTEKFNTVLQNGKATILQHQPYLDDNGNNVIYKGRAATLGDIDYSESANTYKFEKKGNLETIKEIYIIVSGQTASASELLISCLKPYFNVSLVGGRTYGKPVGFFGIKIDQYTIYLSSFLIKNAQGWDDYFDGMLPDISVVSADDPVLGDPDELCLSAAITAISGKQNVKNKLKVKEMVKDIQPVSTAAQRSISIPGALENRMKLN